MKLFQPKLFSKDTMKGYNASSLTRDLIAGIIVAIIALPLSIALAIASGVSPEKGIYTAIVAGFVISFFGGSFFCMDIFCRMVSCRCILGAAGSQADNHQNGQK